MAFELYFASNRLGSIMARAASVTETTTVGSPVRYDAAVVGSAILLTDTPGMVVSARFHMDAVLGYVQEFYLHFEWMQSGVTTLAGSRGLMEVRTNTGLPVFRIQVVSSAYQAQYWDGAAWQNTGGSFSLPGALCAVDIYLKGGVGGQFALSVNGVPEVASTFNAAAAVNLAEIRWGHTPNSIASCYLSQVIVSNFDMRATKLSSNTANASGAVNDGTGSYTDVSTIPHDPLTARTLPADANMFTMPKAAITLPGTYQIDAVVVNGSLRAFGGTVTEARAVLRIGSTNYSSADVEPGLSAGYEARAGYWTISPATSLRFSVTEFNALQFGWEAKT